MGQAPVPNPSGTFNFAVNLAHQRRDILITLEACVAFTLVVPDSLDSHFGGLDRRRLRED